MERPKWKGLDFFPLLWNGGLNWVEETVLTKKKKKKQELKS